MAAGVRATSWAPSADTAAAISAVTAADTAADTAIDAAAQAGLVPRHRLVLYGRSYCHLCDDMRAALAPFAAQFDVELTVIDIDAAATDDPALLARYDELVPVLTARLADGDERQLCHYFLDPVTLTAFFAEAGGRHGR